MSDRTPLKAVLEKPDFGRFEATADSIGSTEEELQAWGHGKLDAERSQRLAEALVRAGMWLADAHTLGGRH